MSLTKNNQLGAGDGIPLPIPNKKSRFPVSSARKFATRGVVPNAAMKQKLQDAIDEFHTPSSSPLKRRSLSMAEINSKRKHKTPVVLVAETMAMHLAPYEVPVENGEERRRSDAARRVFLQLLLNAWRRRRSEVASVVESRDRLQEQIDQLGLQVDCLQKMRAFEIERRNQTNNENKELVKQLEEVKQTNLILEKNVNTLENKLQCSNDVTTKLTNEMMNERNLNVTLRVDVQRANESLEILKLNLDSTKEEVQQHLQQITNYEALQLKNEVTCQEYEESLRISHEKYNKSLKAYKSLKSDFMDLHFKNEELSTEQYDLNERLVSARTKNEKLELKICELKKQLCAQRQQKKHTQDENDSLRLEIQRVSDEFQAQNDRQWWLKTGEFLFEKFTFCAYILFPAMPRKPSPDVYDNLIVLDNSIALGGL